SNRGLKKILSMGNSIRVPYENSDLEVFFDVVIQEVFEGIKAYDHAHRYERGSGDFIPIYINRTLEMLQRSPANSNDIFNPFTNSFIAMDSQNTNNRPSKGLYNGYMYFDTQKKKPIWWYSDKWVDSEGNEI